LRTALIGTGKDYGDVMNPTNHNKFMVVTDVLIDGKLTDILLTGTTNLTFFQMVDEVNSAVTVDDAQTIAS